MGFRRVFFVSLVLVLSATELVSVPTTDARVRSCQPPCDCAGYELLMMSCSQQNLTATPTTDRVMELVVQLDVSHNLITLLPNNTFQQYPNLQEILLFTNVIHTIEVGAFRGLMYLQTVDLSENNIEYIHPETFAENTNLQTLNLSANPLNKLSGNVPIINAPSVTALDLSFSNLRALSLEMVIGLNSLKMLNIQNNNITHFPIEIFKGMENLVAVSLGNNGWECGDCSLVNVVRMWADQATDNYKRYVALCVDAEGREKVVDSLCSTVCNDKMILSLLQQDQLVVVDDEASMETFEPGRRAEVFGGVWFYLKQHSAYSGLVVGTLAALITFFATICICVIRRRVIHRRKTSGSTREGKNMNLLLAYASVGHKRDSTVPLLTPDSCPPSPLEWDPQGDQPPSLYDEFVRSMPVSDHAFSTVDI